MKRKPKKRRRLTGPIHGRIASRREAKNLSQQQLADDLGVHVTLVSHWENGARPDIRHLPGLASKLDMTIAELIAGEDWPAVEALLSVQAA